MLKPYIVIVYVIFLLTFNAINVIAQEESPFENNQQFIDYLEETLQESEMDGQAFKLFKHKARTYWKNHMMDYNAHPEKYKRAITLYHQIQEKFKSDKPLKIDRFEKQINGFRHFDKRNTFAENAVLFVGSSSIYYWETAEAFPEWPVINRGFGGSTVPEIIHYYDDVIKKYAPSFLVVYCDSDIERGISPEETMGFYKEFVRLTKKDFPSIQILILSMKPTLIDDFIGKNVSKNKKITNQKLTEFCSKDKNLYFIDVAKTMLNPDGSLKTDIFLPDGLHMNPLGYTFWNPLIREQIKNIKTNLR